MRTLLLMISLVDLPTSDYGQKRKIAEMDLVSAKRQDRRVESARLLSSQTTSEPRADFHERARMGICPKRAESFLNESRFGVRCGATAASQVDS